VTAGRQAGGRPRRARTGAAGEKAECPPEAGLHGRSLQGTPARDAALDLGARWRPGAAAGRGQD
jgi:hypothetical protein